MAPSHADLPRPNDDRPLHSRVVAVVYDGLCIFEFGCAYEIFGLPQPGLDRPRYRFEVCAAEAGPLRAAGGLVVQAPHDLGLIEQADSVIVPGWRGPDEAPPLPLLDALARVPERGGRLVSISSGVFVLAATGVLDGRRATTHWRYAETLARRYPRIRVDPDVLYVDDGPVLTSAGGAAALDLCLHIVRCDHGAAVADVVARRLVLAPNRDGGQRQFMPTTASSKAEAGRLAALCDWLPAHIDEKLSVTDLAQQAGMSLRTFHRRFREAMGTAPGEWLIRQRIARALHLVESTDLTVEQIATRSGFGAVDTLRHHFRRLVGTTPTGYRRAFARMRAGVDISQRAPPANSRLRLRTRTPASSR